MIPRYSRPDMVKIWEPENKFRIWFEIEAHACDAQAALGVIPESAAKAIWEKGQFDPNPLFLLNFMLRKLERAMRFERTTLTLAR